MLTLDRLRNPTDEECAGFAPEEVDLACAAGLPGSEQLDIPACLAWIDHASAWTRHHTAATFGEFLSHPELYEGSEGIFRVVAIDSVLRRGLGVRYNQERIDDPEEFTDSRDDFIHGIIQGGGGTCASLPVLYLAVGRRLGYPLKLVRTNRHLFLRWDEPGVERFNVEISNPGGVDVQRDEYYLTWPVPIRGTNWRHETKFLQSMTPRDEVSHAWSKRGFAWHANGRLREAVDAFATACSIVTDDRTLDFHLWNVLKQRRDLLTARIPAATPKLEIDFPARRRHSQLPVEVERDIIALEVVEDLLSRRIPDAQLVVCRVFF